MSKSLLGKSFGFSLFLLISSYTNAITPIADAHYHPHPSVEPSELIKLMDKNDVIWSSGGELTGGDYVRDSFKDYLGDRYLPLGGQSAYNKLFFRKGVSGMEDETSIEFNNILSKLRKDLETGKIVGIGELFLNNSKSSSNPKMRRKSNIFAPTYKKLLDLVAEHNGVIQIHAQSDEDTLEQLSMLADYNPNGKIILAHCGTNSSSQQIKILMESHQNIYCDLSYRHKPMLSDKRIKRFPEMEIFDESSIHDDWRELIISMPDRFMVGTDTKVLKPYTKAVKNIRSGLLANLPQDVAEKVAYKNAERILNKN